MLATLVTLSLSLLLSMISAAQEPAGEAYLWIVPGILRWCVLAIRPR